MLVSAYAHDLNDKKNSPRLQLMRLCPAITSILHTFDLPNAIRIGNGASIRSLRLLDGPWVDKFMLPHYVGAIAAEECKFKCEELLMDAVFSLSPKLAWAEILHGILWQTMLSSLFETSESALAFCMRGRQLRSGFVYACLHGIGHGSFYRKMHSQLQLPNSPCITARFFVAVDENFAALVAMCLTLPTRELAATCSGGAYHSASLYRKTDNIWCEGAPYQAICIFRFLEARAKSYVNSSHYYECLRHAPLLTCIFFISAANTNAGLNVSLCFERFGSRLLNTPSEVQACIAGHTHSRKRAVQYARVDALWSTSPCELLVHMRTRTSTGASTTTLSLCRQDIQQAVHPLSTVVDYDLFAVEASWS